MLRLPSIGSVRLTLLLLVVFAAMPVLGQESTPVPTAEVGYGDSPFSLMAASLPITALLADLEMGRLEDGGYYLGDLDAPIAIVEFADWACPHCINYREEVYRLIEEFVVPGLARFEFRMFPTAGGRQSVITALIAECTGGLRQDEDGNPVGFWLASDLLYELAISDRYFSEDFLPLFTGFMEVSEEDLLTCANGLEQPQVLIDIQYGIDHGVNGTPALLIRVGDAEPTRITANGTTYSTGVPPYDVVAGVIYEANGYAPDGSDYEATESP